MRSSMLAFLVLGLMTTGSSTGLIITPSPFGEAPIPGRPPGVDGGTLGASIETIPLPFNGTSLPAGIEMDPSGGIWIAESGSNSIGLYDPAGGTFTHYPIPTAGVQPYDVALDANGNVWFTEYMGDAVGVLYPNGSIVEFPLPQKGSAPYDIIYDSGMLWFTEVNGNVLGSVDPATGTIVEHLIPSAGISPVGVAAAPDGRVWVTGLTGRSIYSFDPALGEFKEHQLGLQYPWGILALANSTLVIASLFGDSVTWYDPDSGGMRTYLLNPQTYPTRLSFGKNDTLWLVNYFGDTLIHLDLTTGNHTESLSGGSGRMWSLTDETSGEIWISDPMAGGLWRFAVSGSSFTFLKSDVEGANAQPIGLFREGDMLWLAESGTGRISRLDLTTRQFHSYPTSSQMTGPADVIVDGNGSVWSTLAQSAAIAHIDVANDSVIEYSLGDSPWGMTMRGGDIWVAGMNSLVQFFPSNRTYVQHRPPYTGPSFAYVAVDASGDLWASSMGFNAIMRYSVAADEFTVYRTRSTDYLPYQVKVGGDGSIWFTQLGSAGGAGPLARLYPNNGTIVEYPVPRSGSGIVGLDIQGGILWLTDYFDNALWRFDVSNSSFERFALPGSDTQPYIVTARAGDVYATGFGTSVVVHLTYSVDRGRLTGKVVDGKGDPVPGADVMVSGPEQVGLTTGPDGGFSVDLLPGVYTVDASAPGYFSSGGAVRVSAGSTSSITLTIHQDPASLLGWVNGMVTDSVNTSLIAGAHVTIGDRFADADADGLFNMTLPEGTYPMRVSAPGHIAWNGSVDVVRGRVTWANVSLQPEEAPSPPPPEFPWAMVSGGLFVLGLAIGLLIGYVLLGRFRRQRRGVELPGKGAARPAPIGDAGSGGTPAPVEEQEKASPPGPRGGDG